MQCLIDWEGNQFLRRVQKSRTLQELQLIANDIQTEVDSRGINYEEANQLGNRIQDRADIIDSDGLIYALVIEIHIVEL